MPRYFIEVGYEGTAYGGFQIQKNANTIQAEIARALQVFYKKDFELTGSSRTDAGVHALQNYFHFDTDEKIERPGWNIYNLNAILPDDIVIKNLFEVADDAHCRFDAVAREYKYFIYHKKNPFIRNTAFYFPYKTDIDLMNEAAAILKEYADFTSFSKRNTQVKHFICHIMESRWSVESDQLIYHVRANRFLRGMVKGLVGTMLRVGRGTISVDRFREVIELRDCSHVDFSVPSKGLFLIKVELTSSVFPVSEREDSAPEM